jgi:hypothetical protein
LNRNDEERAQRRRKTKEELGTRRKIREEKGREVGTGREDNRKNKKDLP